MARQAMRNVICVMHILPQSTHGRHLVAVYGMDDATRSEEQQCLEHGVCEQVNMPAM